MTDSLRRFLLVVACVLVPACQTLHPLRAETGDDPQAAPEIATGITPKAGTLARRFMVSAANPLAVDAGVSMLRAGGTAIDAAIAVQMVLTLVEPQSSGIGGGAFLLYFDGRRVRAYDGRETAPAGADEKMFVQPDGTLLPFFDAVASGRSVGVPGVVRMLEAAHRQHGRLPWKTLFDPAIRLAEDGFVITPRLATLLKAERILFRDDEARAYFYDDQGRPHPEGHRLKNPVLAQTLRWIAEEGADAFYNGEIAEGIAAKVQNHPARPGRMTVHDLAAYRAVEREPLCVPHQRWLICGMPPPSSGGVAVAQMLNILAMRHIARFAPVDGQLDPESVHLFAEAGRLAFADRERYIADPAFAPLPQPGVAALLDPDYLAGRAAMIREASMGRAPAGQPFSQGVMWQDSPSNDSPSTSQVSIVDEHGNALSMTTSIENAFGSRQMVHGFFLNNQLTDFSLVPAGRGGNGMGGKVANRIEPGKRPRSAMSPTLVFGRETGELILAIGSPGGPSIINYVAKALVGVLHWDLNLQEAIDLPNVGSRNGPTELERLRTTPTLMRVLEGKGHALRLLDQTSGLQGVMRWKHGNENIWFGAADPRREGVARGD